MTFLEWTLWVGGSGISLIALLLAISQYFNVKRRRKIFVVWRSLIWSFSIIIFVWIIGLLLFLKDESELKPATKQDVEQIVAKYMGEKPKNPPVEEVKSEIEKELKTAFEKQEKEALELYRKGNDAYDSNKFKEAIAHFKAALQIVKTASLYLSLGNSMLVTSDYKEAMSAYENALDMYRGRQNRQGEGNALGNLGLAYDSLGQYNKARECYEQALYIFEDIKSPHTARVRKWLAKLEGKGK